jgi:hypothetical protein
MRHPHRCSQYPARNLGQLWSYRLLSGPALSHYRSYRCLISDTDDFRISDNIILYPAPLVAPGASRFDQLLALTHRLTSAAEQHTTEDSTTLADCVSSLHTFLQADASVQSSPASNPTIPLPTGPSTPSTSAPSLQPQPVPVTSSTRHRPSSDTGSDLIGWTFFEKSLGHCTVLNTDTYLDHDNILWHTLAFDSSKAKDIVVSKVSEVRRWCKKGTPPANLPQPTSPPTVNVPVPIPLQQQPETHSPFRAILHPPKSLPPVTTHQYNTRTRRILSVLRAFTHNPPPTNTKTRSSLTMFPLRCFRSHRQPRRREATTPLYCVGQQKMVHRRHKRLLP